MDNMLRIIVLSFAIICVVSRTVPNPDDTKGRLVDAKDIQLGRKDIKWGVSDCKDCKDVAGNEKNGDSNIRHPLKHDHGKTHTRNSRARPLRRHSKPFLNFHRIHVKINDAVVPIPNHATDPKQFVYNTTIDNESSESEKTYKVEVPTKVEARSTSNDKQTEQNAVTTLEHGLKTLTLEHDLTTSLQTVTTAETLNIKNKLGEKSEKFNDKQLIGSKNEDNQAIETKVRDAETVKIKDDIKQTIKITDKEQEIGVKDGDRQAIEIKGGAKQSSEIEDETNQLINIEDENQRTLENKAKEKQAPEVMTKYKDAIKIKDKQEDEYNVDIQLPEKNDDRFWNTDLGVVPDAVRLEQVLHPRMSTPVNDIILSLQRMFGHMQTSLKHMGLNNGQIFNTTRHKYMMGVRDQLTSLAEENEIVYGSIMDAALLTKMIYRRAHERRHPKPYTFLSPPVADLRYKTRKNENAAGYELLMSTVNKDKITQLRSRRDSLADYFMRLQASVEENLNARALYDLHRKANQVISSLNRAKYSGFLSDNYRFKIVDRSVGSDLNQARESIEKASALIENTTSIIRDCKSDVNNIHLLPDLNKEQTFDETQMMFWVAKDRVSMHADKIINSAVMAQMKLAPLIEVAGSIIKGRGRPSLQQRLQQTVQMLRTDAKMVSRILDKIRLVIGDERFLKERCETIEGSGGWADDVSDDEEENAVLINCDQFIPITDTDNTIPVIEGSGDIDIDGSGDIEDTLVDIDFSETMSTVVKTTTQAPTKSTTKVTTEVPMVTERGVTGSTDNDVILEEKLDTSSKDVISEENIVVEEEDEDGGFTFEDSFANIFGWGRDAPIDAGISLSHIDPTPSNLNEAIRQRLFNYSEESNLILRSAKAVESRIEDASHTWEKVSNRFANFENRTRSAKVVMDKWKAEEISFNAVHDAVTDLSKDVEFKFQIIEKQCESAVQRAGRKLEMMEQVYDQNKDKAAAAPDPELVQQTRDSVLNFTSSVKEIEHLTKVFPNPCARIDRQQKLITANITELREKIAKAKLIASYMQIPMTLESGRQLIHDVDDAFMVDTPLSSTVEVIFNPDNENGHLLTVDYNQTGSVSVELYDKMVKLTHVSDSEKTSNTSLWELNIGSWYSLLLERLGTKYELWILDEAGVPSTGISVDGEDTSVDNAHPTLLTLGDEEEAIGCLGNVKVNGRIQYLYSGYRSSNKDKCTEYRSPQAGQTSILMDGSGYVLYRFTPYRSVRTAGVKFTANSDGDVFSVRNRGTIAMVKVDNGLLSVRIQGQGSETISLVSQQLILGIEQRLQISVTAGTYREESVLLNGKPGLFKASQDNWVDKEFVNTHDGLHIGRYARNTSSTIGCVSSIWLNDNVVPLSDIDHVNGNVSFGQCQKLWCMSYMEESKAIEMNETMEAKTIHIAVSRTSHGQIIKYSKAEKFDISVSITKDNTVELIESLTDVSESVAIPEQHQYVVVSLLDQPDDKQVRVGMLGTINDISYKGSGGFGGWWFGGGDEDSDPAPYNITIGDNDGNFIGDVLQLAIDDRLIQLDGFKDAHNLQRCPLRRPPLHQTLGTEEAAISRSC